MRTAIHISGLRKQYGAVTALDGLDLDVAEGEMFGLLGPNGAGKTTTVGVLTTRVRATSGEAFVAGKNVATEAVEARALIGVVPQQPNPDLQLTVRENLVFHATYHGIARAEASKSVSEGLRAALTPGVPHMPLAAILAALVVLTVLLMWLGMRGFRRRAIS